MELKKMVEEARKDFEANMNWMDFSNKYFGPGSPYIPKTRDGRKQFIETPEYKEVQDMKFKLEEQQPNVVKPKETFSGSLRIRVGPIVHQFLVEEAQAAGLTLNALCLAKLSAPLYDRLRGRR